MTYLFACIDRAGTIDFTEVRPADFWAFREGLRESDCVYHDYVVLRSVLELERRKTELFVKLRSVWNEREMSDSTKGRNLQ